MNNLGSTHVHNLVTISSIVSEEKSFEIVDGQTTESAYTISTPAAFGSGELETNIQKIPNRSKIMQVPHSSSFINDVTNSI